MFKRTFAIMFVLTFLVVGLAMAGGLTGSQLQQYQKPKGGRFITNGVVSTNSEVILGVDISAGGSNMVVDLYDTPYTNSTANSNCVFEGGAASNTSTYVDFHTQPILTKSGLVVTTNESAGGVVVYTQQ